MFIITGIYWTVISPAYINSGLKSSQATSSWRAFLTKLGVQEKLAVKRVDVEQVQPLIITMYVHVRYKNDIFFL